MASKRDWSESREAMVGRSRSRRSVADIEKRVKSAQIGKRMTTTSEVMAVPVMVVGTAPPYEQWRDKIIAAESGYLEGEGHAVPKLHFVAPGIEGDRTWHIVVIGNEMQSVGKDAVARAMVVMLATASAVEAVSVMEVWSAALPPRDGKTADEVRAELPADLEEATPEQGRTEALMFVCEAADKFDHLCRKILRDADGKPSLGEDQWAEANGASGRMVGWLATAHRIRDMATGEGQVH